MDGNFSDRLQDVIRLSREEALRLGHELYRNRAPVTWNYTGRAGRCC